MKKGTWEVRRALRYGSMSMGHVTTLEKAKSMARKDIAAYGNEGRIGLIDRDTKTLYYDVHPEME